ncbi:hypothetical protein CQA49_01575 [Helicobacter sp. MIT 00-7814]|uniref:TolC family protein n=1 Tax=unclassified Helicobacter TaxID=2593540 RepID=UPI000E1E2FE7|nr:MULTISPECIES: TolC family protein [unclassified Helicobacter]RDU56378.1 hypothetical protein CQA37_02020 [Helicobacter sp. MIT 99-10781]RDU56461.1 hypothetical protein CQA49_01575 [Helicobacter sp. MIT 00-7814]
MRKKFLRAFFIIFLQGILCGVCAGEVDSAKNSNLAQLQAHLNNNPKIKELELEIASLKARAKAEAKWDNPNFNLNYSNAEIMQPFLLGANDMQSIGIGLSQNLDLNLKRSFKSKITQKEANLKLLELENLKNEYAFSLISAYIEAQKNQKILSLTQDSIKNLDTILDSFKISRNFNPLQVQKLKLLKARLQIKQNEIINALENSHIGASEISFESIDSTNPQKALQNLQILSTKNGEVCARSGAEAEFTSAQAIQCEGIESKYSNIAETKNSTESPHNHSMQNQNSAQNSNFIVSIQDSMFENLAKAIKNKAEKEQFLQELLAQNIEIKIAQLQSAIASDSVRLAKKSLIPDLGLNIAYMSRYNRADLFAVGISMPLPIYGKEVNVINQNKSQELLAQTQILSTTNRIKHTSLTLLSQFKQLSENLDIIQNTLLPANKEIINLYKHHSTSQTSGFVELYNALNEEIDTEILRIQILANMAIIYWNLERLKGNL